MSIAEPAQHFLREFSPVAGGYFSSPNIECYSTKQLRELSITELHDYAGELHFLACQAQEQLGTQNCTSEGFCYETILRVKILREVVQILIEKGSSLDIAAIGYNWNYPKYTDAPSETFHEIKERYLYPLPILAKRTRSTDRHSSPEPKHPRTCKD